MYFVMEVNSFDLLSRDWFDWVARDAHEGRQGRTWGSASGCCPSQLCGNPMSYGKWPPFHGIGGSWKEEIELTFPFRAKCWLHAVLFPSWGHCLSSRKRWPPGCSPEVGKEKKSLTVESRFICHHTSIGGGAPSNSMRWCRRSCRAAGTISWFFIPISTWGEKKGRWIIVLFGQAN